MMKRVAGIIMVSCLLLCSRCIIAQQVRSSLPKYLDPLVPIEDRITDLLPRLTLEEKVMELSDSWGSKGIPRLKIPAMLKTEGLHGQSYSTGATIYPMPISMSSTFDTGLVRRVGQATAQEAKAAGIRATWSPVLDVARDARWGRVEETYGEDPYWVSRMGVAWINGFQGEHMIAIPKHFAGHGEPLGGRDSHDVGLSDRVMRDIHLVPFRAAIEEAHAGGVMAAYSTWNGVPDNASVELLQHILREEWGFDGLVVSDCGGPENFYKKQNTAADLEEASKQAILAGVDIECGSAFITNLAAAVRDGLLTESDLDANLRRVFRAKYRLGLFDNPAPDKMVWEKLPEYDGPNHRALARDLSVEGSVLLKNDRNILPLRKDLSVVAVIGPNGDLAQTGDYSAKAAPGQLVTVLQGIRSHVSADTKVLYAKGCNILSDDTTGIAEAVDLARKADAVVLVVGDNSNGELGRSTTGENTDGATLEIPGAQRALIKAVYAAGKPVVLVLVNGKPFTLAWEAAHIPAILETWYPGEEGGNATADLLFGDRNPSGRLPITFPRHVGQLPLNYDYLPSGRSYDYYDMPFTPQYRFGHGMSYTSFRYSNLQCMPRKDDPGLVTVTADITNMGDRVGDEVAQLYVTDMLSSVITPVISLQGVQRVSLQAGETKTVTFELTPYQLSLLNAEMVRVLEPGRFRVHVGGESPAPPKGTEEHKQKIGFKDLSEGISGEFTVPRTYRADFTGDLEAPPAVKGAELFPVRVTVKNRGNLTDVAIVKLYGGTLLGSYHFEMGPGETKTHVFRVSLYQSGKQSITAIIGQQAVSRQVNVLPAPARLLLDHISAKVDDEGVLQYSAEAANEGSADYKGRIDVRVNGRVVAGRPLELRPGEKDSIALSYPFPRSGTFRVRIGSGAEEQVIVPGGIGLAFRNPLLYLSAGSANKAAAGGGYVREEINHADLPVQGTPTFIQGRDKPGGRGIAFESADKNTFINAGGLDLYRKSFTLAAWVYIDSLDNGQAAFFGGQAPMGADIDNRGTVLTAGLLKERLWMSFEGRDLSGMAKVPLKQWVHIVYTYNAGKAVGALYTDGVLDKSGPQQPYAGQLGTIGTAPHSLHGKFAMEDVLVIRSCLDSGAIEELYQKGVASLRSGILTTEWRPSAAAIRAVRSWAEIPPGSRIRIILESGDQDGVVLDSTSFELKNGMDSVSLKGKRWTTGNRIRARIQIFSQDWNAAPVLQTLLLESAENPPLRWSTQAEWKKGMASGGIRSNP